MTTLSHDDGTVDSRGASRKQCRLLRPFARMRKVADDATDAESTKCDGQALRPFKVAAAADAVDPCCVLFRGFAKVALVGGKVSHAV